MATSSDALLIFGGPFLGGALAGIQEAKIESILLRHKAVMARYDAEYVVLQADVVERDLRKKGSQIVGVARAAAGASGFASDSGSNLDAIQDIDHHIELNAEAIRSEGRVKAGQLEAEALGFESQARITDIIGPARGAQTFLSNVLDLASLAA